MNAYASVPLNPFEDDIVVDPHSVSSSVQSLNEKPLRMILRVFSRLDAQASPRMPVRAGKAQLVRSPDRGYGKSHLIGRLFGALAARATTVYVRPFQDPDKVWQSILCATFRELQRPQQGTSAGTLTQLQALSVATLARVAADLLAKQGIPGRQEATKATVLMLRNAAAVPALETQVRYWIEWLVRELDSLRAGGVIGDLVHHGFDVSGREKAWVKVLAAFVLDERHGKRALAGAKWLRAEPLELHELTALGMDAADNDSMGDCTAKMVNALSFQRLKGLCLLTSYYRPFLFCFDQTEAYTRDPALIGALGSTIERLYAELPNQMTVITANSENWVQEILPNIDPPQRDRIAGDIDLEGVSVAAARELACLRLKDVGLGPADIERFFASDWLGTVFSSQVHEVGVRAVLRSAAERFRTLADTPSAPSVTLEELFKQQVNEIRSSESLMAYNQDALMWFVKEMGPGLPGVSSERTTKNTYFSFQWASPDRLVAFAFEGGDHWNRFRAIADEAVKLARQDPKRITLSYVFRTPDLEQVPRGTWAKAAPSLDAAGNHGFHIHELTLDQVCEIHAGRELHANALERNIEYSPDAAVAWLQGHFAVLLQELIQGQTGKSAGSGGAQRTVPPTSELDERGIRVVADLVREYRVIDINTVLSRLGDERLRDPLLRSVERHPNLKAHPGPRTIYLQWRTTPSQQPS